MTTAMIWLGVALGLGVGTFVLGVCTLLFKVSGNPLWQVALMLRLPHIAAFFGVLTAASALVHVVLR